MFYLSIDKQLYLYYDGYTKGGIFMFYDMFLDEVIYLSESEFCKFLRPNVLEGLKGYSKREAKNFSNGKVSILRKEKDIEKFIKFSRNVLSNNEKFYYGKIDEENAKNISRFCHYDLKNFNLSLPVGSFKHIFKRHADPIKERLRRQIAVTDADYYLIPYIIRHFDSLKFSVNYNKVKILEFNKLYENVNYTLIMYISFKSHNLEVKTFYKK